MNSPSPQPPIQDPFLSRVMEWFRSSLFVKISVIGFLLLILLIPLQMVRSVVSERMGLSESVQSEISSEFGYEQTFSGPVLTVPYTYPVVVVKDKEKQIEYETKVAHFLPADLNIKATVAPEERHRGLFDAIVYNADLKVNGRFDAPDFKEFEQSGMVVDWSRAKIHIGLSDLRSIKEQVAIKTNDTTRLLNPGESIINLLPNALEAPVDLTEGDSLVFSFDIAFGGSRGIHFTPLGKETVVEMESEWHSPSATGAFLPDKKDEVKFFPAQWKVLHLNRPFPQQFQQVPEGIHESDFGVALMLPVNGYSQTDRCLKYGVLIISLTFLVFFFTQAITRRNVHSLQYLVVGFGLVLFYLLLVSLSEHMTFEQSYLIASASIVTMVTAYMAAIFKKLSLGAITLGSLGGLYVFIFVLVRQEDYALLMGSIGLTVVLSILMLLTRRMDWLRGRREKAE